MDSARSRVTWARLASTGIAEIGTVVVNCSCHVVHSSTFLHPLAPPELPGFNATMGALTPVQAALRTGRFRTFRNPAHERRHCPHTGLPALRVWPSEHSVPNHLTVPAVALTHNPSARQAFWASPLGSRLADRPGRNGFVILRTARSHPVALPPLSQGRSYFQIQAGVCMPEKDLHLSDQTRSQAHCQGWLVQQCFAKRYTIYFAVPSSSSSG